LYVFVFDPTSPAGNTVGDAFTAWLWEKGSYNSTESSCPVDAVCDDFLQLAWANGLLRVLLLHLWFTPNP